jgi:hypothetical protein
VEEAEACLEGVILTAEWVRQPAIIELDCSSLIAALHTEVGDIRLGAGVIKDIRATCGLLPNFRFETVRRETIGWLIAWPNKRSKE